MSYDPVPVLATFAQRWGIAYRLLSDEGSRVIRRLGLHNEHLDAQAAAHGVEVRPHHVGVPYPGTFVLDERGIVVDRQFEQSYRVRPSGAAVVERLLGGDVARAALPAAPLRNAPRERLPGPMVMFPFQRSASNRVRITAGGLADLPNESSAGGTRQAARADSWRTRRRAPFAESAAAPNDLLVASRWRWARIPPIATEQQERRPPCGSPRRRWIRPRTAAEGVAPRWDAP